MIRSATVPYHGWLWTPVPVSVPGVVNRSAVCYEIARGEIASIAGRILLSSEMIRYR